MKQARVESPARISSGGLFYQLMLRLRLVAENRYHPWRRIYFFVGLTWLPLVILTLIDGTLTGGRVDIPLLHDPEPHMRYLLALPLLVLAEMIIDPYIPGVVSHFQNSGLIPRENNQAYSQAVKKLDQLRDALWVDPTLLAGSFGLVWLLKSKSGFSAVHLGMSSWILPTPGKAEMLSLAGWWILLVSGPVLLFLLLRWVWRFLIWVSFIAGISRFRLELQPTHPDKVGGLGILTGAQFSYGVVFASVGTMMSASLANEIINTGRTLSDLHMTIVGFIVICAVLIILPLCTFSFQLTTAKRLGLRQYSALAYQLSEAFNTKWIKENTGKKGAQIITAVDPSAVADYGAVYETIKGMGFIPLTRQKLLWLLLTLAAPFVPLIFTQFSISEALERLAQTLV